MGSSLGTDPKVISCSQTCPKPQAALPLQPYRQSRTQLIPASQALIHLSTRSILKSLGLHDSHVVCLLLGRAAAASRTSDSPSKIWQSASGKEEGCARSPHGMGGTENEGMSRSSESSLQPHRGTEALKSENKASLCSCGSCAPEKRLGTARLLALQGEGSYHRRVLNTPHT